MRLFRRKRRAPRPDPWDHLPHVHYEDINWKEPHDENKNWSLRAYKCAECDLIVRQKLVPSSVNPGCYEVGPPEDWGDPFRRGIWGPIMPYEDTIRRWMENRWPSEDFNAFCRRYYGRKMPRAHADLGGIPS